MTHIIVDYSRSKQTPTLPVQTILNPILVWVALNQIPEQNINYSQLKNIITSNDQTETLQLVNHLGTENIINTFNNLLTETACNHILENHHLISVPTSWNELQTNAITVYKLFYALAQADTETSKTVIGWMRETTPEQRFGFTQTSAVKASWGLHGNQTSLIVVNIQNNHVQVFTSLSHTLTLKEVETWQNLHNTNPALLPVYHCKHFQKQLNMFHKMIT